MNSAKELLRFSFTASVYGRRTYNVSEGQSTSDKLSKKLKEIENRHRAGMRKGTRPEDIQQIYHRFIQVSKTSEFRQSFSNRSSARKLAWALTYFESHAPYDRSIVSNTGRLENALTIIEKHFSTNALLGVFDALLQVWDKSNAGLLRGFLRKQLTSYTGRRRFVRKLKASIVWYCDEKGATQLALDLLRDKKELANVWTYLELPNHMHSYPYFGFVVEAYTNLYRHFGRPMLKDIVKFIESHNDDQNCRAVLTKLIERLGTEASEHLRQPVQSYVLRTWQDPRITGASIRWRGVSDSARKIFERWITKDDLRLFFDVVAKACNDSKFEYRKEFWMSYLEHISFCRPVLRNDVEYILSNNPKALQYYKARRPATLKGGTLDQHAFIIQMRSHTFVEFSTAGACYVYRDGNRPFHMNAPEYYMSQLRHPEQAVHRVIHSSSEGYYWQSRFKNWIGRNLHIRQSGNYLPEDDSRYF